MIYGIILTYVLAAVAGAIATWRKPALGVGLLLCSTPFDLSQSIGPTTLQIPKTILFGIFFGLLIRQTSFDLFKESLLKPVLQTLALISILSCASTVGSDYKVEGIRQTLKAFEYAATFLVCLVALRETPDRKLMQIAFATVSTAVLILALPESLKGAHSFVLVHGVAVPRIAGPLEGPNQLAGFLETVSPVFLALAFFKSPRWIFMFLLCLIADILTQSRSGLIALLSSSLASVLFFRFGTLKQLISRSRVTVILVTASLIAVAILSRSLLRFGGVSTPDTGATGLGTRSELWNAAIVLWKTHPILGIGPGNFEFELPRAGVTDAQTHANSLYLQTLSEGGVLALGALVAFVYSLIRLNWRFARNDEFAFAALVAALALFGHQIFDDVLFFPKVALPAMILFGSAAGLSVPRSAETASPRN